MSFRGKLFSKKNTYDLESTNELFLHAMKENCAFHYAHCEEYRKVLDGEGFSPENLASFSDLSKLPFLPTLFFKKHHVYSLPKYRLPVKVTSSGTSGQFSRIGFAWSELWYALKMAIRVVNKRHLVSLRPCNYIVFGYKPNRHNKTGVTKTAFITTLLAPALHRTYALKYKDGKYEPDLESVIRDIEKYAKKKTPVRFMGFPSYTTFVMQMMEERKISVKLPKGSKIMLAGGWKQFYTEEVEKSIFYDLAKRVLGVSDEDIVEFFGAVEHPILYCDCKNHHFHVPVYGRVLIRDVNTLEPVPYGTPGLVNLLTPLVKGTPLTSVMTDDLGILHDGTSCGCGQTSPYLDILGRVGLKDIKTCAAGAAEYLNKGDLK